MMQASSLAMESALVVAAVIFVSIMINFLIT